MASDRDMSNSRQMANQEKQKVGASSVGAAVLLTTLKIVVGLMTGSLGILSEAAHSGLDLVAAVMTWLAVRISGRPADREHTYGHGKVENLSALFETILLLATCAWIIKEALERLFFKHVVVDANIWAFLVMAISIVVDLSRSRALMRVAKKYGSQALEADALHFSTDIWSSSVVILGLVLVRISEHWHLPWLAQADAVTALVVAGIVIYVSLQLGRKTISDLLDAVPPHIPEQVTQAVQAVPGVKEATQVRIRRSGAEVFADITLSVNRDTSFERAHDIASMAESAVQRILPGSDVVVHLDPIQSIDEGVLDTIRLVASRFGLVAHGIRIYEMPNGRSLELHLEVDESLRLDEAHAQATRFEQELRKVMPEIEQIVTHIEPAGDRSATRRATTTDEMRVIKVIESLPQEIGVPCQPHEITVHRVVGEMSISFHCDVDPSITVDEAHRLTERLEQALHTRIPSLNRVVIHMEPKAESHNG